MFQSSAHSAQRIHQRPLDRQPAYRLFISVIATDSNGFPVDEVKLGITKTSGNDCAWNVGFSQ